uniref:Uncharacterized protein n=1 Tax=Bostrychia moritziana TaxID=103713 RepID=A0A1Z1M652_BOSMO|nr:hypothetical protein [Bostrychia moritziana]ARW61567.1 hypothetical protein [Bostrychia moritziana]
MQQFNNILYIFYIIKNKVIIQKYSYNIYFYKKS